MIENKQITATACVYNGKNLHQLRQPVATYIQYHFHKEFNPEDETQAGEYYIDCISVNPAFQGQGVGSKMLLFLIDEYVQRQQNTLGLLVDADNPSAKKLYLRLGFQSVDYRTLAGKPMEHLQFSFSRLTEKSINKPIH
jgi:ribosomal protein S18 acetylase RimI-like enzyme